MAGDWIKMRTALATCPQVVRIASGHSSAWAPDGCPHAVRRLVVVGALHATWTLADTHTTDGVLLGYTREALDEQIGLPGWSAALEAVGWLVVSDCGITVPRFEEHNGATAKRRALDASRKGRVRNLSASDADKCPPAKRTERGTEKRREEKKEQQQGQHHVPPASAPPPAAAAAAGVPPGGDPTPPDPSVTSTAAARSRPGHAEIAERLVAELLAPAGLEGAAAVEAAEHLADARWLGGHSEAQVREALAAKVRDARRAANPAGWLRQAIRDGRVPTAPAAAASEGRDPRLRSVDDVVAPEVRAWGQVRAHRGEAERLRDEARRLRRRDQGQQADELEERAALHEARAAEIEQALEAAQAQAVAS